MSSSTDFCLVNSVVYRFCLIVLFVKIAVLTFLRIITARIEILKEEEEDTIRRLTQEDQKEGRSSGTSGADPHTLVPRNWEDNDVISGERGIGGHVPKNCYCYCSTLNNLINSNIVQYLKIMVEWRADRRIPEATGNNMDNVHNDCCVSLAQVSYRLGTISTNIGGGGHNWRGPIKSTLNRMRFSELRVSIRIFWCKEGYSKIDQRLLVYYYPY